MIIDKNVFLPHTRKLQVRGLNERFFINLNMNVGTYYTVRCLFDGYGSASDNEKIEILLESTTKILQLANRKINRNWIKRNIDIQQQSEIVVKVIDGVNKLLTADYLQIPNIKVKEKPNKTKYEKERAEKKKQIEMEMGNGSISPKEYMEFLKVQLEHDQLLALYFKQSNEEEKRKSVVGRIVLLNQEIEELKKFTQ